MSAATRHWRRSWQSSTQSSRTPDASGRRPSTASSSRCVAALVGSRSVSTHYSRLMYRAGSESQDELSRPDLAIMAQADSNCSLRWSAAGRSRKFGFLRRRATPGPARRLPLAGPGPPGAVEPRPASGTWRRSLSGRRSRLPRTSHTPAGWPARVSADRAQGRPSWAMTGRPCSNTWMPLPRPHHGRATSPTTLVVTVEGSDQRAEGREGRRQAHPVHA